MTNIKELRKKAIDALGGQCVECGCTDYRVLQVNHIKGGGSKEARERRSISAFYRNIIDGYRPDLNILCANCNILHEHKRGARGQNREEIKSQLRENEIYLKMKQMGQIQKQIPKESLKQLEPELADAVLEQREESKIVELELIKLRLKPQTKPTWQEQAERDFLGGEARKPRGFWLQVEQMPEKGIVFEEIETVD